jgi:hypothetical protein
MLVVKERSNQDILVLSGTSRFFEAVGLSKRELAEQHYSVHTHRSGLHTIITQKTTLADGVRVSNAAFIHNTRDWLLWPIYARRLPMFKDDTNILDVGKQGEVVDVGEFEWQKANLLYSVFVAKTGSIPISTSIGGAKVFISNYRRFCIVVVVTYLNLPSMYEGDVAGLTTSSELVNGRSPSGQVQVDMSSIPVGELEAAHWFLMRRLRERMIQRLQDLLGSNSPEFDLVTTMTSFFTACPGPQGPYQG